MDFDWHKVWLRKGTEETEDLVRLNGYEKTNIDPGLVADQIKKIFSLNAESRVLEIGCGAGMIAQFLDCNYVGVDYSETLVEKIKNILKVEAFVSHVNELPFEDNSFDYVFAYSVFHYFPNRNYANETIKEMTRVARKSIFIGDLPEYSHDRNHLLFSLKEFPDWIASNGFYNDKRFNIFKRIHKLWIANVDK